MVAEGTVGHTVVLPVSCYHMEPHSRTNKVLQLFHLKEIVREEGFDSPPTPLCSPPELHQAMECFGRGHFIWTTSLDINLHDIFAPLSGVAGGLSAQAFLRIEIEDINDNHPIFNPETYMTSISNHMQPGTEVMNVVATDKDSGIYGAVTYEVVPGDFSSLFTVDTTTGMI
uniref:Uncharacterized protein n=1 Tax=Sphaerodactylus townsendi TaxID=933632 RepID=A0ACB8E8T4_9SAUR